MIGALQERSWKGIPSLDGDYLYRDSWKLLSGPVPDFGTIGRFPLLRTLMTWGFLVAALVGVLFASATATVAAWVPLEDGRVLVIRNAWPQGQVPDGARVIATVTTPQSLPPGVWDVTWGRQDVIDATILGKATELTRQRSGRVGYETPAGDQVRVDTTITTSPTDAYLALCNQGACAPGEYLLLPVDHVLGRP